MAFAVPCEPLGNCPELNPLIDINIRFHEGHSMSFMGNRDLVLSGFTVAEQRQAKKPHVAAPRLTFISLLPTSG